MPRVSCISVGDTVGSVEILSREGAFASCKCSCGEPVTLRWQSLVRAKMTGRDSSCPGCKKAKLDSAKATGRARGRLVRKGLLRTARYQ